VTNRAGTLVALATSIKVPQLTDDDRLLVRALAAAGVGAQPAVWNDAAQDWTRYSTVIIRSTWDYHLMHDEFLAWLERLEAQGVQVLNQPALVRWNSQKGYLRELAERGIEIVPTRWVERGEETSLSAILRETRWTDVVVKPSVSASAHETWRASDADAGSGEGKFAAMVSRGGVLVQPFLDAIQTEGEWSLLFYGGAYSHAVLKRPKPHDFRVQREHGGTAEVREPFVEMIHQARRVLEAAELGRAASLYARVDGCVLEGRFVLMELELIEPDLFLRGTADAPKRLAAALIGRMSRGRAGPSPVARDDISASFDR
jgi:glutathione synthase/RimK-type ligase-like ATP-grasp enzyme